MLANQGGVHIRQIAAAHAHQSPDIQTVTDGQTGIFHALDEAQSDLPTLPNVGDARRRASRIASSSSLRPETGSQFGGFGLGVEVAMYTWLRVAPRRIVFQR